MTIIDKIISENVHISEKGIKRIMHAINNLGDKMPDEWNKENEDGILIDNYHKKAIYNELAYNCIMCERQKKDNPIQNKERAVMGLNVSSWVWGSGYEIVEVYFHSYAKVIVDVNSKYVPIYLVKNKKTQNSFEFYFVGSKIIICG